MNTERLSATVSSYSTKIIVNIDQEINVGVIVENI